MNLCANPSCDRVFVPSGRARYCSRECQTATLRRIDGAIAISVYVPARVWHRLADLEPGESVEGIVTNLIFDEVEA